VNQALPVGGVGWWRHECASKSNVSFDLVLLGRIVCGIPQPPLRTLKILKTDLDFRTCEQWKVIQS
jgi:hypothetical protein